MTLRTVDLFAGGGGLSLGFLHAGFNIVAAFDNWEPACDLYSSNLRGHPLIRTDLANLDVVAAIRDFKPNIIIGGPPCQDFSSAGKRNETLGRADLTLAYTRIVQEIRPDFFVMENVDRALKSKTFATAKKRLKAAGYGLTIRILDASLCGVPQLRKRLFVIGQRDGVDDFLSNLLDKHLSKKPMTLRDFFGGSLGLEHYYRHPRSYKRRGVFSIDEPSPTVRGVNRPIPKGYPGHSGDTSPIDKNVRPLTTKERSLIQTFPRDFVLSGSKTDIEQIIGNAVPVRLAEYVAQRLKEYMLGSGLAKEKDFCRYKKDIIATPKFQQRISKLNSLRTKSKVRAKVRSIENNG